MESMIKALSAVVSAVKTGRTGNDIVSSNTWNELEKLMKTTLVDPDLSDNVVNTCDSAVDMIYASLEQASSCGEMLFSILLRLSFFYGTSEKAFLILSNHVLFVPKLDDETCIQMLLNRLTQQSEGVWKLAKLVCALVNRFPNQKHQACKILLRANFGIAIGDLIVKGENFTLQCYLIELVKIVIPPRRHTTGEPFITEIFQKKYPSLVWETLPESNVTSVEYYRYLRNLKKMTGKDDKLGLYYITELLVSDQVQRCSEKQIFLQFVDDTFIIWRPYTKNPRVLSPIEIHLSALKFIYIHNDNRMQLSFSVDSPLYSASENGFFWNKFNITIEFSKATSGLKFKKNLYVVIESRNFPIPEERRYSDIKMSVSKSAINLTNVPSNLQPDVTKVEYNNFSSLSSSDFSVNKDKLSVTKSSIHLVNPGQLSIPIPRSKVPSFSIKQVAKQNTRKFNSTDDEFWDFPKAERTIKTSTSASIVNPLNKSASNLSKELSSRPFDFSERSKKRNKNSPESSSSFLPTKSLKKRKDRSASFSIELETPSKSTSDASKSMKDFCADESTEKIITVVPSAYSKTKTMLSDIENSSSRYKRALKRQKNLEEKHSLFAQKSVVSDDTPSNIYSVGDIESPKKKKPSKESKAVRQDKLRSIYAEEKTLKEKKKEQEKSQHQKRKQVDQLKKKQDKLAKRESELSGQKKQERTSKKKEIALRKTDEPISHEKEDNGITKINEFQREKEEENCSQNKKEFLRGKQKVFQKPQLTHLQRESFKSTQAKLEQSFKPSTTKSEDQSNLSGKSNKSYADLNNIQLDELLDISIENMEDIDDSFDNINLSDDSQKDPVIQDKLNKIEDQDARNSARFYKSQDLDEIDVIESSVSDIPQRLETSNHSSNNLNLEFKVKTSSKSSRHLNEKQSTPEKTFCKSGKILTETSDLARTQTKIKLSELEGSPKSAALILPSNSAHTRDNYGSGQNMSIVEQREKVVNDKVWPELYTQSFADSSKLHVKPLVLKTPNASDPTRERQKVDESDTLLEVRGVSHADECLPWMQPSASQVQVNEKARALDGLDELRDQSHELLKSLTAALVKKLESMEKDVLDCDENFEKWFLREAERVEKKTQAFISELEKGENIKKAIKYETGLLKWIGREIIED